MQSTPTLKEADPHDVFAIETVLAAHAHKAPPLAQDPTPAAPPIEPQVQAASAPQVHVAPPISVGAPEPQVEPTFRATDMRDIKLENVKSAEIKVDGFRPAADRPIAKWVKRAFMALLGLGAAMAAAAWQQYGDEAKAMAVEWVPPFMLAALPSTAQPAAAEQPSEPVTQAAATDQGTAPPPAQATPPQGEPAATAAAVPSTAAAAPSAETTQLQSMAQDLATMGQQVEELKATIVQLKASQAQMARDLAKASEARAAEAKAAETRTAEPSPRPRVSALTPPPVRPVTPPPAQRKPKPVTSYSPSYSPAPMAAPVAPPPPVQAAAPLPPQQTIADDGEPVVRPPMPLR